MTEMYVSPSGYQTTDVRFAPGMEPLMEQIARVQPIYLFATSTELCPTEECDWCGYGIQEGDKYAVWGTRTYTGIFNVDHLCVGCNWMVQNRVAQQRLVYVPIGVDI
tara:strand:+ start:1570 stop:1890 length:321 start_codon:yes stop_codon:yes gene_type:complete